LKTPTSSTDRTASKYAAIPAFVTAAASIAGVPLERIAKPSVLQLLGPPQVRKGLPTLAQLVLCAAGDTADIEHA